MYRLIKAGVLSLALALFLVACQSAANADPSGSEVQHARSYGEPADQTGLDESASEPVQGRALVAVAETSLGPILVDSNGLALYVFTDDLPNTPSCYGECQEFWPPLVTVGDPQAGDGVDPQKLGTAIRTDGIYQVSYGGRPLYLHIGDSAAGDTSGHGKGNVWLVLSPSGEPLSGLKSDEPADPVDEEYDPDRYY